MTSVLRRTIRGGLGFLTANAITRLCGLLFVVVAGRLLGPAGFGVLSLALSVAGLARRVSEFGLTDTLVRMLAGEGEEDAEGRLGAALALGGVLALIGAASLYALAPWLADAVFSEPRLTGPLQILGAGILLWVPLSLARSLLQASERVGRIVTLDLAQQAARVAVVAAVLMVVGGVDAAAAAVVASLTVPLIVAAVHVRSLTVRPDPAGILRKLRPVASVAAPLLVVGFSYTLARYADRLMLGALGDARQVGVYTVAATLAMAALMLHGALVSGLKPIIADAHRKGAMDEARRAYLLVSKWAGAASGFLVLIFAAFGPEVLTLFGADYATAPAHRALLLLGGLFFVATWIGPTGAVLQMSGGERLELVNTTAFLVVNVTLNFLLIPRYGIVGAAAATLSSGLVRNGMQVWELSELYDFSPIETGRLLLLAGVAAATLAGLAAGEDPLLGGTVVLVSAGGLGWYLWTSLTDAEREYLARIRTKVTTDDR